MPIYNIKAPSGKIYNIEGPENADRNALFQAAKQLHDIDEEKKMRRDYGPGLMGTAGQAITRGFKQLGPTTDVLMGMAGKSLGFEDYAKQKMAEADQRQREIFAEHPPIYESFREAETPYQKLQFATEVMGEQVANLAGALIPGVGGSVLAGRAALTSAGKALANQAAQKGLTGEALNRFIAIGMKRAAPQIAAKAKLGGGAGIFLGSYAQNAPEVFQNIYKETGQLEPGVSLIAGAAMGALDSILPMQLAKSVSAPLKVGIVEKVLEKSGMDKSILRSVTANMMKGVAGEGLTEGAQEAIGIAAEKFVAKHPQHFGKKEWDRIMESSVRGAIAGGGFGAIGGGIERGREVSERKDRLSEALARRAQRQEAAAKAGELRRASQVADAEILAAQKELTGGQMQLPGMEREPPEIASSLYTPKEIIPGLKGPNIPTNKQELKDFGVSIGLHSKAKALSQIAGKVLSDPEQAQAVKNTLLKHITSGNVAQTDIAKIERFLRHPVFSPVPLEPEVSKQLEMFTPTGEVSPEIEGEIASAERKKLAKQEEFERYKNAVQSSWVEQFDADIEQQGQDAANLEQMAQEGFRTGQRSLIPEVQTRIDQLHQERQAEIAANEIPPIKTQGTLDFGEEVLTPEAREAAIQDVIRTKQQDLDPDVNREAALRVDKAMGIDEGVIGRTEEDLQTFRKFMGIRSMKSPILEAVANKSIYDPSVVNALTDYANRANAPRGVGDKVDQVLTNPFRQTQSGGVLNERSRDVNIGTDPASFPDISGLGTAPEPIPDTEGTRASYGRPMGSSGQHIAELTPRESGIGDPLKQDGVQQSKQIPLRREPGQKRERLSGDVLEDINTIPKIIDALYSKTTDPDIKQILRKIARLNLNTKIVVKPIDDPGALGFFSPKTNTIVLDPERGVNRHAVIHELVHAAIYHVLHRPNLPITKEITTLFNQIQSQLGAAYGGTNIQEFAAELVGNPKFRAFLKEIKAPRSENMLQRIVRLFAEFFGFSKGTSAYDRGLKLINDALDVSPNVERIPLAQALFLATPNASKPAFDAVGRIGQAMPNLTGRTIENTKNFLSNLPQDLVTLGVGLLRLDNINTIYKKELPSIQKLLDALELRHGMEERLIKTVNENYKFFEGVQKKNPTQFKAMEDMAYDARLEQVDPRDPNFLSTSGLSETQKSAYKKFRHTYLNLNTDVRKTYDMIRDAYDNAINEYEKILVGDPDKGIPGVVDKSIAAKIKLQFQARKRQIAYIPFLRKGEFWVEYDVDGERAASAFESIRERDRFINEVLKPKGIKSKAYQNIQNTRFQQGSLPPSSFIVQVMSDLTKQGVSDEVKNDVYQTYLALFPAESLVKNFMKSDNIRGMERDIVRGYGETMLKWSRKLAKSKYNPDIDRAVSGVVVEAENIGTPDIIAVAQNIQDQSSFFHNPTYNKATSAATTLSYFTYIAGNVSSALVNLTTLPMFSWPILGARYGFDTASGAMLNGSRIATNYLFGKNKPVPRQYQKLFDALNDHAQLEHTLAREVLEGRRQATSDFIGVKAKIMDGLSKPFHMTEILNRGATAIAAYDLARKGNPSRGVKPMSEQDAIRYALNTVKQINTSGLSATAPSYMQHPFGRVFFTFKSFIWNQAFVIARSWHQAMKGADPNVRKESMRQLIGMYGTAMAFAGIKGLPFMGATSVLVTMLNTLMGDEDEPFDFDVMMQDWSNLLLYKGMLNYALNVELSNRIGVANDLIYRDDPRSIAEHGYVLTAMKQAFGPAGAFVFDAGRGAQLVADGDVYRGIEAMMPSFIKNGMKAMRFAEEGVLTLKGQPIVEDLSAYNLAMQALGFSPANLTRTYEEIGMLKEFERELMTKRTKLLNKYEMAYKSGDYDLLSEVQEDIDAFNERRINPKARITPETLKRSLAAREAAEKQLIHGIRFNKALRPELDKLLESFGD